MVFKPVLRWDPRWPKLRLFRVMWNVGTAGDGVGYSRKVAVALRPRFFRLDRDYDGWRLVVLGVEVHSQTSWGGRFV